MHLVEIIIFSLYLCHRQNYQNYQYLTHSKYVYKFLIFKVIFSVKNIWNLPHFFFFAELGDQMKIFENFDFKILTFQKVRLIFVDSVLVGLMMS